MDCLFNKCRGQSVEAGYQADCPFGDEDDKEWSEEEGGHPIEEDSSDKESDDEWEPIPLVSSFPSSS